MSSVRPLPGLGLVVIGRNEGERLKRCLRSVIGQARTVVYVDSGSNDGSVAAARALGAEAVELDMSQPFTAARARNAGFRAVQARVPEVAVVQFVDGDCELVEGWLARGAAELQSNEEAAVVCGRTRERHPDASRYNMLCDLEWDTRLGEVAASGGIFMVRAQAFGDVGGFDPLLIAGEEPELCLRLRRRGWKILRLNAEMALHDAAMTRFAQWWRRTLRGGHSFAESAWRYGLGSGAIGLRPVLSILAWALFLPLGALAFACATKGLSLLALGIYPLQWLRIWFRSRARGWSPAQSRLYASFILLGKFAQLGGVGLFLWSRVRRRRSGLIEHRTA